VARRVVERHPRGTFVEPEIPHAEPATPAGFFSALREAMPRDAVLVTDSGLHQTLARCHYRVLAPRGLLVPTGLQSMGFGVPAAIGASLAAPERRVVALVGDGGFAMSGMELLTAVRERVPLVLVVFVDGHYGLIRAQQLQRYGHAPGSAVHNPDFARWAESLGVAHVRFDGVDSLHRALALRGPVLVEVAVRDSNGMRVQRLRALARVGVNRALKAVSRAPRPSQA
jgi:acetolactate synthase-1/2/3 large subunit